MSRTGPQAMEMSQCILCMVQPQVDPKMLVLQVELAPVAVVAVLDPDDRLAEIRQVEQEPLLDLLELAALDLVRIVLVVVFVAEKLITLAEILRQIRVDEGHIVMDAADLEDLLPAQAKLLVPLAADFVIVAFLPFWAELPLVPTIFDIT